MSLKAFIPSGQTALTVNGLHQWDYGQKLEIHDDDLPALVEVHFACAGMTEAVVRSCSVVQGVAEAVIPDQCLEQTTPIVAWVYAVGESSGATIKTITLTVIQRARPQPSGAVPTAISDKYTELMAAVNEQVAALRAGNVTVARALTADKATEADWAKGADMADAAADAAVADVAGKANVSRMLDFNEHDDLDQTIADPGLYLLYLATTADELKSELLFVPELGEKVYTSSGGNAYCGTSGRVEALNDATIHSVIQIGAYTQNVG